MRAENNLIMNDNATEVGWILLSEWGQLSKRAARAARAKEQLRAVLTKTTTWKFPSLKSWCQLEHTTLNVTICSAHTSPVIGYFANIVECEQNWIVAKSESQLRKQLFPRLDHSHY